MKTRTWYGKSRAWILREYPDPGKYEGGFVIDEYVHDLTMDGCSEGIGDVSTYGTYHSLLEKPLLRLEDMTEEDVIDQDYTSDEVSFLCSVGAIVEETDQGFVTVEYFDDVQELGDAWDALVTAYEEDTEEENPDD